MPQDAPPPPPPPERTGPRPMLLHLALQGTMWLGWPSGLTPWNAASPFWKPPLAGSPPPPAPPPRNGPERTTEPGTGTGTAEAEAGTPEPDPLRALLHGPHAGAFLSAVESEASRRLDAFLAGVEAYRTHPWHRPTDAPPAVWQKGTTVLRDYKGFRDAPPVLLVPSLINRAYVLDLTPKRSLARFLAERGHRPFLVDWTKPGEEEATFGLDAYITERLEPALDAVIERTGQRPAVVGYCMGGLLALALAARRPDRIRALALLATPWDFHAQDAGVLGLSRALAPAIDCLDDGSPVPTDLVQLPFTLLDPLGIARKYAGFAGLPRRSARARDFLAVEDWLNDGVPLSAPLAKDCLSLWYEQNHPGHGDWTVAGTPVRPDTVTQPTLVVIPDRDRIVPPASAIALASRLPGATIRHVPLGHVGMVTGRQASVRVYRPLAAWLARQGALGKPPRRRRTRSPKG